VAVRSEHGDGLALRLFLGVAGNAGECPIDAQNRSVGVHDHDAFLAFEGDGGHAK